MSFIIIGIYDQVSVLVIGDLFCVCTGNPPDQRWKKNHEYKRHGYDQNGQHESSLVSPSYGPGRQVEGYGHLLHSVFLFRFHKENPATEKNDDPQDRKNRDVRFF